MGFINAKRVIHFGAYNVGRPFKQLLFQYDCFYNGFRVGSPYTLHRGLGWTGNGLLDGNWQGLICSIGRYSYDNPRVYIISGLDFAALVFLMKMIINVINF